MRRIRRILVAIKDPGAGKSPAVMRAAQLAHALGAELALFQAISAPTYVDLGVAQPGSAMADIERTTRSACLARLEATARPLRRAGLRVTVSAAWDYPVYEAIIREAARFGADLIVAERHAGRHLAAGFLHLTDWELLRLSPRPVLLVKRPGSYRRPVVLAAVDPDHAYAKPVRLDQTVLQMGAAVAGALRGTLHAVHAYAPLPVAAFAQGVLSGRDARRLQAEASRAAARKLERAVRTVGVPRARRHLVGRHPADAIEQVAARTGSALVVMGAIARSGLKRLVIGNTAERVLDRLPCDLLIVKPAKAAARVPRARRGVRYADLQPSVRIY
ncbi:MAG TPA: universal stress protein [Steroidobacteraceae bacterium]|nr:universal stress protein [Steroidobacteraceae bacterium]